MTKQVFLGLFERRLVELYFPARPLRKQAAELADHFDFLHRTGVKEGWSEPQADAYAAQELGDPVALAEKAVAARRQSSWWWRHRVLGFIVLPAASLAPALFAAISLMVLVVLSRMTPQQFNGMFQDAKSFKEMRPLLMALWSIHYFILTLVPLPFCWMARRSASGLKWAIVPCLICAAQGMFFYPIITMRDPGLRYHLAPNLLGGLGPLLVAVAGYWRRELLLKRLPPLPESLSPQRPGLLDFLQTPIGEKRPRAEARSILSPPFDFVAWFKKSLRMPTYWIIALIFICAFLLGAWNNSRTTKRRRARTVAAASQSPAAARSNWSDQHETVVAALRARQSTRETTNETTIDLKPYINAQLSESTDGGAKGFKENSLSELPDGKNIYGGVPFDVQGRIQLMGLGMQKWNLLFPVAAKDIKVGRKCSKIFLFHGSSCDTWNQVHGPIAKLVLHYADGSERQIEIKSGEHLLDWWGIVYTAGPDNNLRIVSSPDSELAWIGDNPLLKRSRPAQSLRLFKSAFDNPQPDVELDSLDYISTMTQAAPFMVGLTVE